MRIFKIAFTGGPSAGKSTMFNHTKEYLIRQGYKVLEIPETATELIEMGTKPESFSREELKTQLSRDVKIFQDIVYDYQTTKEKCAYKSLAYNEHHDLCIILCDRGILDNIAYLDTKEDFEEILKRYGDSEIQLLDSYDLVIKLTTLAITKPECYETEFKGIARENIEFARYLDDRTTKAWLGHHNMHIIDTSKSEEEVSAEIIDIINRLIQETERNEAEQLREKILRNFDILFANMFPSEDDKEKHYVGEEFPVSIADLCRYNKNNSRKIHVKRIHIVDSEQNTYDIHQREFGGNTSFLVSKNGTNFKQVTRKEIDNILGLTPDELKWEEYDEISIYENMRLYTIKDYGEEKRLVIYDEDLVLPEGIELKANRNQKTKKLQK